MPPIINKDKCIGCMNCTVICSADVFGLQKKGAKTPEVRFPEECWYCSACVRECPAHAIQLRTPLSQMMVFTEQRKH